MSLAIDCVLIDCNDLQRMSEFWGSALNLEHVWTGPSGDYLLVDAQGTTRLGLMPCSEAKRGKNRVHLDLRPDNQDVEIQRLEELGAARVEIGQRDVPGSLWRIQKGTSSACCDRDNRHSYPVYGDTSSPELPLNSRAPRYVHGCAESAAWFPSDGQRLVGRPGWLGTSDPRDESLCSPVLPRPSVRSSDRFEDPMVDTSTSHPTSSSRSRHWPWLPVLGGAAVACLVFTAAGTAVSAAPPGGRVPVGSAISTNQQEAVATYNALQQNFYVARQSLYRGTPSNTCGSYSCLWPFTNATAGTVYLYGAPNGARYLSDVAARQTGLGHYVDPYEVSPSGAAQPPAYESAAPPPLGPGGATYYDDNGWVGLNLVHAYLLTSNRTDLTLAQDEFDFVVSGWDTNASDGCPGGVFWEDIAGSQRNATANGGGAALALELDRLTGNARTWHGRRACTSGSSRVSAPRAACTTTMSTRTEASTRRSGATTRGSWSARGSCCSAERERLVPEPGRADGGGGRVPLRHGIGARQSGDGVQRHLLPQLVRSRPGRARLAYASEAQSFASTMWAQRQARTGLINPQYGVNGTAPMVEIFALLAGSSPTP